MSAAMDIFGKFFSGGDSTRSSIISINLFVALLCVCIIIGHFLGESRWMNESITSLLIGLCTGVVVIFISHGKSSHLVVFSEELFFIYVLPPIIFNAGFQVKKKQFFRNFVAILLLGAVGTFVSFIIISLGGYFLLRPFFEGSLNIGEFLALGTIFSATDSVCTLQVLNQEATPLLYSLVFGEGVVNDATSIVLFNTVKNFDPRTMDGLKALNLFGYFAYLFLTSTALGITAGLLSAYIIKNLSLGRHSTDREVAIMILLAYLSYMLAELFDLSGILAVFFSGIVMSHYTWHNLTVNSKITTRHTFATMSFIAEVFIFFYVGMDAMDIDKWNMVKSSPIKYIGTSAVMLCLVLLGRAAFVFPISFVINCVRKKQTHKISWKEQIVIWWAGLMRGAVSIALAYNQFTISGATYIKSNAVIITSTIIVVIFSTGVFGILTKPLIKFLLFKDGKPPQTNSVSNLCVNLNTPLIEGSQSEEPSSPHRVRDFWRKVDNRFMRPVFGGRGFVSLKSQAALNFDDSDAVWLSGNELSLNHT